MRRDGEILYLQSVVNTDLVTPENTDIEGVVESGEVELDVEDVVDAVVHCPVQLVAVLWH